MRKRGFSFVKMGRQYGITHISKDVRIKATISFSFLFSSDRTQQDGMINNRNRLLFMQPASGDLYEFEELSRFIALFRNTGTP